MLAFMHSGGPAATQLTPRCHPLLGGCIREPAALYCRAYANPGRHSTTVSRIWLRRLATRQRTRASAATSGCTRAAGGACARAAGSGL